MKSRILFQPVLALAIMAVCGRAQVLVAQDSPPAVTNPAPISKPAAEIRPGQLSYGVEEVLKLGSSHVSEEVITAFVKSSGRIYNLSASEILYLREQGLSDRVLTAMLESRKNVAATVAQPAPQTAPAAPVYNTPQPAPAAPQQAPTYVVSTPVYTQPAPVYVYPAVSYGYYSSWPYYYNSCWNYPSLSFRVGFGAGRYAGYHGGGGYRGTVHFAGGHRR